MELDGLQELAVERQRREDFFEKAFDPTHIEKGRRAQIGETRDWKGGTYKKTKDGWVPVPKGGGSKGENLVGKTFNYGGVTYKVTKQGVTQSEAEAVTESLKGKRITIDNKVVEKQDLKGEDPKTEYSAEKKKLFDSVREWSGDDLTDKQINTVYEEIYGRRGEQGFKINPIMGSINSFYEKLYTKVDYLVRNYSEQIRRQVSIGNGEIRDIIWGILMSKNN